MDNRHSKYWIIFCVFVLTTLSILLSESAIASHANQIGTAQPTDIDTVNSPRLIVELESPPLAELFAQSVQAAGINTKLDTNSSQFDSALTQLQAEQSAFIYSLQAYIPSASVGTIINEQGESRPQTYQIVFNGMAINPGKMSHEEAMNAISQMPGVKNVYPDLLLEPQLYRSVDAINAPAVWNSAAIGGIENAGRGIKIASIDLGVHHAAPMFDGTGYEYPPGYGPNGLGYIANNNGKIIVSRAYFRDWDPPLPGEEFAWPGPHGDSHGTHTASIAAGRVVSVTLTEDVSLSGVAPAAYVMSYKTIYSGSRVDALYFFTTDLLMALEDVVLDGADIVNNSWGIFRTNYDHTPVDTALVNVTKAGIFVVMAAGNDGPTTSSIHHQSSAYISVAAASLDENGKSRIPFWSSRGPGVSNVLKPDILAPGVNIVGQGYTAYAEGENKHLGFGTSSGTSMAAPHISGAAALLKQIHPNWTNDEIKSALMSTANYLNSIAERYQPETEGFKDFPAQPLDMGAGMVDVAAAVDPGVILDPPSLSFGLVPTNTQKSIAFRVRNITDTTETYTVTTQYTEEGIPLFADPPPIPGFSTTPYTFTLAPSGSEMVTVTFRAGNETHYGDNQGYVVLDGDRHHAHLPAWARTNYDLPLADVLIIDFDTSEIDNDPAKDVSLPYMQALAQLGYSFVHHPIYSTGEKFVVVPTTSELLAYKAIILITGGNSGPREYLYADDTGAFAEYLNHGGAMLAMSPNLAELMGVYSVDSSDAPYWYWSYFGTNFVQDSASFGFIPPRPISSVAEGPPALADLVIAVNETSMDEISHLHRNAWPNDEWELVYTGTPLFQYPMSQDDLGVVGMGNRHQPSFDQQDIPYLGRTVHTTFGLEDMLEDGTAVGTTNPITPTLLLDKLLDHVWSEPPTVSISSTAAITVGPSHTFTVTLSGGVNQMGEADPDALNAAQVRWRFGDGTADFDAGTALSTSHKFLFCGGYSVWTEVTDRNHNVALAETAVSVESDCVTPIKTWLPYVPNNR